MRIVLVVADSLRADAPGFAGGPCRTGTLDRLAREGSWFRTALTCSPWTVPSIAAMATGVWAHRLGLYRWEQPWPEGLPNVFGTLAAAGHRTASFVFDPAYLFRGVPEAGVQGSSQDLDAVVDWLDRCTEGNLFLFVHYWGTHFPYLDRPMDARSWKRLSDDVLGAMNADPGAVRPKVRALQRRAVERLSERFLQRLAPAATRHAGPDGSCLIVVGDHGEGWGERLPRGAPIRDVFDLHGNDLFEKSLRVPLVFGGPRRPGTGPVGGLARTVDIAPTVLDLAGVAAPAARDGGTDGVSLLGALGTGADAPAASAVAARSADFLDGGAAPAGPDDLWIQYALRTPEWKYLWSPGSGERVVFDLRDDPGEARPRASGGGEPAEGWGTLERERRRSRCAPAPDRVETRLRRLGYID